MKKLIKHTDPVLLVGDGELIASAAVCLLTAGHTLNVCTQNVADFNLLLNKHIDSQGKNIPLREKLAVSAVLKANRDCSLVIAITHEDEEKKKTLLQKLTPLVRKDAVVAINTETISLEALQKGFDRPERLMGLNWTEPAHTTFFLEVIASDESEEIAKGISILAKLFWSKDPYLVKGDGIRSRLVSAMAREASFLVDNGYASVDDIDRACRNDAGYYLPFCGNCRYMDLMGTYAYGMVMKDLNPDLSKDTHIPRFMDKVLQDGGMGMKNKKGFYTYTDGEVERWHDTMEKFSYQIRAIIEKYPFNYNKETYTD
ncbi:3-hydroxyacyl-CoA dehydrogenase [Mucilaginibacter mali]|uniref:3-hydroxyacyl-CoA dehydrogenase n=1 Tax=Mucilaginibacter mali TaxID=2740462 RepID=A0A7D4PXQ1_9SPHI|nr:3-hydroxyacyl-CoA dehydrogenase NAD-binding domain-containing protein [Mucilaginibacter mali]QKJ32643.1 3-hydroxyacyl-CoA dehydrogenase [Mucilaginibacter mali]